MLVLEFKYYDRSELVCFLETQIHSYKFVGSKINVSIILDYNYDWSDLVCFMKLKSIVTTYKFLESKGVNLFDCTNLNFALVL